MIERGGEGVVAKEERSVCVGGLTRRWLKTKLKGWSDPEDRWPGALLEPRS